MTFYTPFSGAPSTANPEWQSYPNMGEAKAAVEKQVNDMLEFDNNMPYMEWYDTEAGRWYKLQLKAHFALLPVDSEEAVSWNSELSKSQTNP